MKKLGAVRMRIDKNKLKRYQPKLNVLKHISKKNCPLLPFLSDESLHTIGEFVFNVVTKRIKLNDREHKKVKKLLNKNKDFYVKLISKHTKNPITYFKGSLKSDPQVGTGIVSLIATLAPLIGSLLLRK